jgi:hypothetical protein
MRHDEGRLFHVRKLLSFQNFRCWIFGPRRKDQDLGNLLLTPAAIKINLFIIPERIEAVFRELNHRLDPCFDNLHLP